MGTVYHLLCSKRNIPRLGWIRDNAADVHGRHNIYFDGVGCIDGLNNRSGPREVTETEASQPGRDDIC